MLFTIIKLMRVSLIGQGRITLKGSIMSRYCPVKTKKRRLAHLAKGLCAYCSNPLIEGKSLCLRCWTIKQKNWKSEKYLAKVRANRLERKLKGLCYECPNPAREGRTRCEQCAIRNKISVGKSQAKRINRQHS